MGNSREDRDRGARAGAFTVGQAAASGGMVAVVGVILLASWILKAEPRPGSAPRPAAPAAAASPVPPATDSPSSGAPPTAVLAPLVDVREPDAPPPTPPPLPSAPPKGSSVAERARRDAERLTGKRDRWTAQAAAVCSESSVASLLEKTGRSDRLYLLPLTISGRSCYRVLWGTYESAAAASAAVLPAPLAGREKPRALAVAGLLP